ncbi:MAG: 30S ribosomal protein S4 [Planctomycetaceae bacterium]
MGHHTGPKGRVNRRLGAMVYENAGAVRALEKRDSPPGMAQRRRKLTSFGIAMQEKQKIKFYYGLRERQIRLYFDRARKFKGNTGEALLIFCERRLDNVVRRAGFTLTRPQARQGIAHRHFRVNGRTVGTPSILVRPGDVITVRDRPNLRKMYQNVVEASTVPQTNWISFDPALLEARVLSLPTYDDVSLPVDVGQVVAFLSR